jgi:transcriptional regulator with XRE-family HTH domain
MASLSERLKRERELRGISLKQISEETRIGVRFLEALEEGRLEVIPGEFYRRSYLRSYARYLGLDEDRAVNAYDYARKEQGDGGEEKSDPESFALPPWVKWVVVGLGIAIPAVLLLRAMPAATDENGGPPPAVEPAYESRDSGTPAPLPIRSVEPRPLGEAEEPAAPPRSQPMEPLPASAGPLRLAVLVDEPCWLEIEADGEVAISGLKEAGFQSRVAAGRELRLWLGNAGGVRLVLNDRPVKPLGRPGQVRKDLIITADNVGEFLSDAPAR